MTSSPSDTPASETTSGPASSASPPAHARPSHLANDGQRPQGPAKPTGWLVAALFAAVVVAGGDVLSAAGSSAVETPTSALTASLLAALALYGGAALALGLLQAVVADSVRAVLGTQLWPRAQRALKTEALDLHIAALTVAGGVVLVLDAAVLYGFVRGAALEMANKRNGALSSALVAVATLPLVAVLGIPAYRMTRVLARILPRPRTLWLLGLIAVVAAAVPVLALLSVDWRIIHFGPWKVLGGFVLVQLAVVWLLGRPGLSRLGSLLGVALLGLWLFAGLQTLRSFGAEARSRALVSEETAGAKVLLKRARGFFDHDGDGYSSRLGGGDCDDKRADVYPGAEDVPGDGIDQDCDGSDAEKIVEAPTPPPENPSAPKSPEATPPSIPAAAGVADAAQWRGHWLIITIDTLRADRIRPQTAPNLAELAGRAVHFTQVYAQAPNTPRSFPSFLTSRFPSEVHFVKQSLNFSPLTGKDPTLFTALQGAGYRNIGVFSHFYLDPKTGLSKGFAEYHNDGATNLHDSNTDIAEPRITARVLDRLKALGQQPGATDKQPKERAVLWTHLFGPHSTYMDHPEFPVGKGFKYVQERYDAEVKFTDQHVGKILDGLRAAGLAENTAVVVFSDHGEAFGEHKLGGEALYFHGEALYNEVLKVPLLIYVPGMTPRVVTERAMLIDMAPTVLELAGVARPGSFRGRSLLAAMRGEATPGPIPPAYAEMLPCTAWQKNERVLINTVGGEELAIYAKYTDNLTELYSLADDATQQRNVSSKKPEQTRAMQQALAPYLRIKPDGGR